MKTGIVGFVVALIAAIALSLTGCGGGDSIAPITPPAGVPGGGTVVTDNPSATMPFSEVQALPRGTELQLRLNRDGYTVREYNCSLISAFVDTGEHLVECQVPDSLTIGAGDSGSPLLYKGKVVGALCYGYDGDHKNFFAKSMDDMDQVNSYVGTASSSSHGRKEISLAFQCNASDRAVKALDKMGLKLEGLTLTSGTSSSGSVGTCGGVPEPASAIAGQSVSVDYVRGDLLNGGAVGTLSFRQQNGSWLAFGHPLDFYGERQVPVSLAWMDAMIDTTFGSFKQAHPTKEPFGALVQDRQQGCLINPAVTPATANVVVKATCAGRTSTYQHDVLQDGGSGAESYFASLCTITSLDRALGAISKMASSGTVTVKYQGGEAETTTFETPVVYTMGGVTPPYDASSEVTGIVSRFITSLHDSHFGKSLESVVVEVEFHDWVAPVEEPGKG